jgi:hypothetical protein
LTGNHHNLSASLKELAYKANPWISKPISWLEKAFSSDSTVECTEHIESLEMNYYQTTFQEFLFAVVF